MECVYEDVNGDRMIDWLGYGNINFFDVVRKLAYSSAIHSKGEYMLIGLNTRRTGMQHSLNPKFPPLKG